MTDTMIAKLRMVISGLPIAISSGEFTRWIARNAVTTLRICIGRIAGSHFSDRRSGITLSATRKIPQQAGKLAKAMRFTIFRK